MDAVLKVKLHRVGCAVLWPVKPLGAVVLGRLKRDNTVYMHCVCVCVRAVRSGQLSLMAPSERSYATLCGGVLLNEGPGR